MKRTPITSKTTIARKTPLRARSKRNSYRWRERKVDYMRRVRRLPCIVSAWRELSFGMRMDVLEIISDSAGLRVPIASSESRCWGRVQADHAGERPLSHKAGDGTVIPLCKGHHGQRTDYRGMFKDWNGQMMRVWCTWAINETRLEVGRLSRLSE